MDELEKRLTHTVTIGNRSWTLRRPTIRQMVAADVLAAQLRQQIPLTSLTYGVSLSEMIASLNTYVIEPKDFDFGELYDVEEISQIYQELAKWLDSFRGGMEERRPELG